MKNKIDREIFAKIDNPFYAHILPFLVFMFFLILPSLSFIKHEHSSFPWWRQQPEHWLYPIQSIICFFLVIKYIKYYQFTSINIKQILIAILFGFLGIVIWILPSFLYTNFQVGESLSEFWQKNLGLVVRDDGFDPYIFESKIGTVISILFRFFRMVVVVAFVEEIFWRGFLMRYLINDSKFNSVKFGTYSHLSFWVTTLLVIFAHSRVDWLGALIYAILAGIYTVKFKNLLGCVLMHSCANLLLGIYVLKTGMIGFW